MINHDALEAPSLAESQLLHQPRNLESIIMKRTIALAALALTSSLALAACTDDTASDAPRDHDHHHLGDGHTVLRGDWHERSDGCRGP